MIQKKFAVEIDMMDQKTKHIGRLVRNDFGGNILNIRLTKYGKKIDLTDAETVTVYVRYNGQYLSTILATVIEPLLGHVQVLLTDACVGYTGLYEIEVEITSSTSTTTSAVVTYDTRSDLAEGSDPSVDPEYPILIQLIQEVNDLNDTVTAAEEIREDNEDIRIIDENGRISNENTRISNENGRNSAETIRVSSENTRISNEDARLGNEVIREQFEFLGEYNTLTNYVVNNVVRFYNSSYVCIVDSVGQQPNNINYWTLVALKGDDGGGVIGKFLSSGVTISPSKTDNGNGSITVGIGTYRFYPSDDFTGALVEFEIAGNTFTLTNNTINYIVANYNSGTPILEVVTDVSLINTSNVIPILTISRMDNDLVILDWNTAGNGLSNKNTDKSVKLHRFEIENGLSLSTNALKLLVTAGKVWYGSKNILLSEVDTTLANDDIWLFENTNGTWTRTVVSDLDNLQYNNPITGFQPLSNQKYGVSWVFRTVDENKTRLGIVLGIGNYSISEAQSSVMPELPNQMMAMGVFIGRIIIKKSDTTAHSVEQVQNVHLAYSQVSDHNNLVGLQGGTAGEYYHLTSDELADLNAPDYTPTLTNYASIYAVGQGDEGNYVAEDGKVKEMREYGMTLVNELDNTTYDKGTVTDNILEYTPTAQYDGVKFLTPNVASTNDVIFLYGSMYGESITDKFIIGDDVNFTTTIATHGGGSAFEALYRTLTEGTTDSNNLYVKFASFASSGFTPLKIDLNKSIQFINKTALGLEALSEANMLYLIENGYIDGMQSVGDKKITSRGKNKFDKRMITKGKYLSGTGTLLVDSTVFTSDYIHVKKDVEYYKNSSATNSRTRYELYDSNKNFTGESDTTKTFTPTIDGYVRIGDYNTQLDILQLEEGAVVTDYEAYKEDYSYLPNLRRVPTIADENDLVNRKFTQDVEEYALVSGDITQLENLTTVQRVRIDKQSNYILDGTTSTITGSMLMAEYVEKAFATSDDVANENKYSNNVSSGFTALIVPLGTYADLSAAQTALAGTIIQYQLATPIIHNVNTHVLDVKTDGDIIRENKFPVIEIFGTGIDVASKGYSDVTVTKALLFDHDTGQQTVLDVADFTVTGTVITNSNLASTDLIWLEIEYSDGRTIGKNETVYPANFRATSETLNTTVTEQSKMIAMLEARMSALEGA